MRRLCGEAALIAAWLLQVDGLLSDLWPGRVHIGMTAGVHLPRCVGLFAFFAFCGHEVDVIVATIAFAIMN